ncbi:MAG TPA: M24 family metallopeptidase [Thermodesulfobacteriota bacterium]|nr:M24 family metallopeptidase [Thermodesulfobacteriota bacterium]
MSELEGDQSGEREQRWQRVRKFMKEKELDVLVVVGSRSGEPLDRYLSNWVPGCIAIFPVRGEPALLVPMIPEMLALRPETPSNERPWIKDIRAGARGAAIAAVLQEKGLDRGFIGVVGLGNLRVDWEGWIPFKTWERVLSGLPQARFQDVTAEFAEVVMVKSSAEIYFIRRAAQVLEQACEEMLKTVCPEATELEVYAAIQSTLSKSGAYSPKFILRSGPDNVSWEDPPWFFGVGSPRVLKPGDLVLSEIFAWFAGLEAQVQMSVAIPPVSEVNSQCARLARLAYEEGVRYLKPGKKFAEVVGAMEAVLDRPGVWHLTPLIHSMNPMRCIGPTGVRIESLPGVEAYGRVGSGRIRGGDVVLEPGMVFELESNACIERHRVNIGGTVIVTRGGNEPLNELPCQMRLAGEVR